MPKNKVKMYKTIEITLLFLLGCVVAVLFWSCVPSHKTKSIVTVSVLPQKWLVEKLIGSASVRVQVMVPAGSSPESYDPTPQDLMALSKSDVYFSIGDLGFEKAWLPRFRDQNTTLPMVEMGEGIERLTDVDGEETDPHLWTTPENMKQMARLTAATLVKLFPESKDSIATRLELLTEELDSMHRNFSKLSVMASSRTFVIYHPALSYLARDYNLTQLAIEHDHKEPSVSQLQALVEKTQQSDAKVLLMQQELDVRLVESFAQETGLRVVRINVLSPDWETEMRRVMLELTR